MDKTIVLVSYKDLQLWLVRTVQGSESSSEMIKNVV
jgi:hypothetical protein